VTLAVARYIASSALSAISVESSVTSSNIANADTTGYTKKTANQAATVVAGSGTGTTVTSITSSVDRLLLKSLIGADADLGYADTVNDYLDQLQSLFGTTSSSSSDTDSGTSLANTISTLMSALSSLADTPSSASLQATVVDDLDAVATQLRSTSQNIQDLRSKADQEIADSVDQVNSALHTIDDLNKQITQAAASGQSTADLEDQRNQALQTLGSLMNVSYFEGQNGAIQVYTSSGQALVDSTVHEVSYEPASSVTADSTYSATPPSGFSGITVNGKDITGEVTNGKIGALVTLRDKTLPQAQSELDELATTLASSLNTVHNQGTSVPPPTSLTSSKTLASTDAFSGSGTVRFAVTDKDGKLVSYADLDLSSYSTVGDLVNDINKKVSGLSASIDSDGHLVVAATGTDDGVAINAMTSSVGKSSQSLSDWLGLNDLVSATGASDFAVRSDILSNTSLLAVGKLDSSTTLTTGSNVISSGTTAIVSALYDTLNGSTSFKAAGGLGATKTSFTSYAADIVADGAAKSSNADSTYTNKKLVQSNFASTMSSETGVNVDEETSRLSELQNSYKAAAEIITALNSMFQALLDAVGSAG
jgi:flagellar hook-associated protein 1